MRNIQVGLHTPVHAATDEPYPHLSGHTVCGIWLGDFLVTHVDQPGEGVTCKNCLKRLRSEPRCG